MQGELTDRQQEVLDYLRDCIRRDGRPPTRREASAHFGWRARDALMNHLAALEEKGKIRWDRGAARGIVILDNPDSLEVRIPVLSDVAAGPPAEAALDADETIPLPRSAFPRPEEIYALRVRGRSMVMAGIQNGDLLIVRKANEAKHKQIVVARIDGEVTLKRFMREGRRMYLKAENPKCRSIYFKSGQEVVLEGIVLAVLRLFQ